MRHRRRSQRHRLRLAVGVAVALRAGLEESHDVVGRQTEQGIVAAKKSIDSTVRGFRHDSRHDEFAEPRVEGFALRSLPMEDYVK